MRGARIAEKIQEFYHTTAVPSGGFTSGSQTLQLSANAQQNIATQNQGRDQINTQGSNRNSKMILANEQNAK